MRFFRSLQTFLFFALSAALPHAEVVESKDWIVDSRIHKQITAFSAKVGTDDTELGKGRAIALISTAGCNFTLIVVGPITGNAQSYARKIDEWREKEGFTGDVQWSQEDDCASVKYAYQPGKIGVTSASTNLDLPRLREALLTLEPKTQFAASDAPWSKTDYGFPAEVTSALGTRYWNLTRRPDLRPIVGTIRLAPWIPALMVAWFLWPILGILASFATGIVIAKNQNIPLARRRKLYGKAVTGGSNAILAVHTVIVLATLPTRLLDPMAQLWFGLRFTQIAIPIVPLFVLFPLLALPVMNRVEKKLMGPSEEERLLQEPETHVLRPLTTEKPGWMLRFTWVFWGIGMAMMASGFLLPKTFPFRPLIHLLGVLIMVVPPLLGTRKLNLPKFEVDDFTVERLSTKLRERVALLADRMRMEAPSFRVLTEAIYNRFGAILDKQGLGVSIDALESMEIGELDFLIAHEMAHAKLQHLAQRKRAQWIGILFAIVPMLIALGMGIFMAIPGLAVFSPFATVLLVMGPTKYFFARLMRRQELEADHLAVATTGDVEAARSALRKATLNTDRPGIHDLDMSTHPAVQSRLAALGIPNP